MLVASGLQWGDSGGEGSSCLICSSLICSCLTSSVKYGSSCASSMMDGLRSQSGESRSMVT